METRTYEGQDAKMMLKTVLNVLQDEGFIVDYGNSDLGLLHGSKILRETASRVSTPTGGYPGGGYNRPVSPLTTTTTITIVVPTTTTLEATANVSEFGNQIKVRVNFQRKSSNTLGTTLVAIPLDDPKFYQEFFAKLDRGLFIQKQGL